MQRAPKYRQCLLSLSFLGTQLLHAAPAAAPDADFQEVRELEALAKSEAERQFPPLNPRQRFLIGPIEPNLQLERCRQAVKAGLASVHHMQDRATVELRCQNPTPWHIYVQVRIIGTSSVAVAAHAIVAGSVLTAKD